MLSLQHTPAVLQKYVQTNLKLSDLKRLCKDIRPSAICALFLTLYTHTHTHTHKHTHTHTHTHKQTHLYIYTSYTHNIQRRGVG